MVEHARTEENIRAGGEREEEGEDIPGPGEQLGGEAQGRKKTDEKEEAFQGVGGALGGKSSIGAILSSSNLAWRDNYYI